jgi:hypothetical protein
MYRKFALYSRLARVLGRNSRSGWKDAGGHDVSISRTIDADKLLHCSGRGADFITTNLTSIMPFEPFSEFGLNDIALSFALREFAGSKLRQVPIRKSRSSCSFNKIGK